MIKTPYKAYRVYIWDPKYSTLIYATSASKAKSKYYDEGEFTLSFFDAVRQMVVRREKDKDLRSDEAAESLEYVNRRYSRSFAVGQQVKAGGCEGWIIGGRGGYVLVGHGGGRDYTYHPSDVVGPTIVEYGDGEPCTHPGCSSHISHPCEWCGRIGARGSTRVALR